MTIGFKKRNTFWERKVVDGDLGGGIQATGRKKPEFLQFEGPVVV